MKDDIIFVFSTFKWLQEDNAVKVTVEDGVGGDF